jgi:subtilisin family serine protease
MALSEHTINVRPTYVRWLKMLALALFIALVLCLLLRCCSHKLASQSVPKESSVSWFPSEPGHRIPIDTSMIRRIPNDPLNRELVSNLLNIYLTDTTDIKAYVARLRNTFPSDSVVATYYAEEYKRVQVKFKESRLAEIQKDIKSSLPETKFVVPEWVVRRSMTTNANDPGFKNTAQSWSYQVIGLERAWMTTLGNPNVIIAVLDDGFDLNHPELNGKFVSAWNVVEYQNKVESFPSGGGHGTHVAATIIGNINNNFGLSGVAPSCRFMPVQISDRMGIITLSSILDGIFYALKNKAKVINMSFGTPLDQIPDGLPENIQRGLADKLLPDEEAMWDEVFEIAENDGVTIVQAAGNDGKLAAIDPMKRTKHAVVVGAYSLSGEISNFSNWGPEVTLYAPGEKIFSALPNNGFGPMDGTSMATPIVSGCVGLALSVNPNLTPEQIRSALVRTAKPLNQNGSLIIQIDNLITEIQ